VDEEATLLQGVALSAAAAVEGKSVGSMAAGGAVVDVEVEVVEVVARELARELVTRAERVLLRMQQK
jgi:hypothetical protein